MIVGTNIGAGVLSIAYASSKAGFLPLLFWLVLVGSLTTITMLYVAESTLRTRAHLQLSGLAKRYVGGLGAWLMFASVCVNSVGALTAYMTGSGKLLQSLFGISPALGSLLFFVPAAGVLYLGLKAIGRGEKFISIGMVVMLTALVAATLLKDTTQMRNLLDGDWRYMVPVFNVVVFCFSAQYIVPEMARGFADKPEQLPKAIIVGMVVTFILLAAVPMSVIALSGLDDISDVATISWGQALGQWAFFSANIFALCAMLTSYWGLGGSFLTNIFDKFRLGNDELPLRRFRCAAAGGSAAVRAGLQRAGVVRQRALLRRGVQRGDPVDHADADPARRAETWRPDPALAVQLDHAPAAAGQHCAAVPGQRGVRHRFIVRLSALWMVICLPSSSDVVSRH